MWSDCKDTVGKLELIGARAALKIRSFVIYKDDN